MQFITGAFQTQVQVTTHRERKIDADESIGDGTVKTRAYGKCK